jgi:signal transduction histidine kinase
VRGRLTPRVVIASGLLAVLVGAAFAVLLSAVSSLRDSNRLAQHSFAELARAGRLERGLVDAETGLRGYALTREPRFLVPFERARAAFPVDARALAGLADDPGQRRLALRIAAAGESYLAGYGVPLVRAVRRDDPRARSVALTAEGKRRMDAVRALFRRYERTEALLAGRDQDRSDRAARRAVAGATAGLVGSVLLILALGGSFLRAVVLPVRRAATMAGRLAGGDLSVRMPETGSGEIGELERAFNTMGDSLERSRDALQRLADEQAALRRVATLVAQGVSPDRLYAAVAAEVGRLFAADAARLYHQRVDGTELLVAEADTAGAEELPDEASEVSRPIVVDGRPWGRIAVGWRGRAAPAGVADRLGEFGDLVATAIANAQSRAELAASRARIVAAGDETRRRIERDLHDGAQQRLVSLALALRAAEAKVAADQPDLRRQLADVATAITNVTDELREMSRGLHPAILSKGGLGPALRALARRSAVPVDLDLDLDGPLPERVEVAAYYVASEALTNAAKHARASAVSVRAAAGDGRLRLVVSDDGVGGADPAGSGLLGLRDRVEAIGGRIEVSSSPRSGTTLRADLPIADGAGGAPAA